MDGPEVTVDVEKWQTTLSNMFSKAVQVVPAGDALDFHARPNGVHFDYDTGQTYWSLGVSETHEARIDLSTAVANDDGTVSAKYQGQPCLIRPSDARWV